MTLTLVHMLAGKLQRGSLNRVFCDQDLWSPLALKPLILGNVCCICQGNMDSARSGEFVEPYLGWSWYALGKGQTELRSKLRYLELKQKKTPQILNTEKQSCILNKSKKACWWKSMKLNVTWNFKFLGVSFFFFFDRSLITCILNIGTELICAL